MPYDSLIRGLNIKLIETKYVLMALQLSPTWYRIPHSNDWRRTFIKFETHKRHDELLGHLIVRKLHTISMAQCKTAVIPLLTHWSYCSLALSHRFCYITASHSISPLLTFQHPWVRALPITLMSTLMSCLRLAWSSRMMLFSRWTKSCLWPVSWNATGTREITTYQIHF